MKKSHKMLLVVLVILFISNPKFPDLFAMDNQSNFLLFSHFTMSNTSSDGKYACHTTNNYIGLLGNWFNYSTNTECETGN